MYVTSSFWRRCSRARVKRIQSSRYSGKSRLWRVPPHPTGTEHDSLDPTSGAARCEVPPAPGRCGASTHVWLWSGGSTACHASHMIPGSASAGMWQLVEFRVALRAPAWPVCHQVMSPCALHHGTINSSFSSLCLDLLFTAAVCSRERMLGCWFWGSEVCSGCTQMHPPLRKDSRLSGGLRTSCIHSSIGLSYWTMPPISSLPLAYLCFVTYSYPPPPTSP